VQLRYLLVDYLLIKILKFEQNQSLDYFCILVISIKGNSLASEHASMISLISTAL